MRVAGEARIAATLEDGRQIGRRRRDSHQVRRIVKSPGSNDVNGDWEGRDFRIDVRFGQRASLVDGRLNFGRARECETVARSNQRVVAVVAQRAPIPGIEGLAGGESLEHFIRRSPAIAAFGNEPRFGPRSRIPIPGADYRIKQHESRERAWTQRRCERDRMAAERVSHADRTPQFEQFGQLCGISTEITPRVGRCGLAAQSMAAGVKRDAPTPRKTSHHWIPNAGVESGGVMKKYWWPFARPLPNGEFQATDGYTRCHGSASQTLSLGGMCLSRVQAADQRVRAPLRWFRTAPADGPVSKCIRPCRRQGSAGGRRP